MYNQQYSPCMHCMQMTNMNDNYMPMMPVMNMDDMCDHQLEMMYPKIYHKILPMVKYHCDMMEQKHGMMCHVSKEYLDSVCENICSKIEKEHEEKDDEHDYKHKEHDCDRSEFELFESRQFGGRGLLRDLVGIVFINELLGRRRRRRRRRPRPRPYHGGYGY